jgi:DNA-binding transcriptional LysR family regulator
MTIDRLDAMRTFVAIVDAGSFSSAARHLGISVPAISRRLSGFEERLGTSLLRRTTRSLDLTEYGQNYYDRAKHILAEIEDVELELAGMRNAPAGLMRVVAPSAFGRTFVAPVIPEFLSRYPRVRVDLCLGRAEEIEPATIDAAVQMGTHATPAQSVGTRSLGSFRQVLCASPGYLRRAGTPTRPDDLAHHDCVQERGTGRSAGWSFHHDGRDVEQPIRARLVCDDSEAALNAALAGSGVVRIPSFQARDHVRARRLEVLLENFEPPPTTTQIAYSKQNPALPKVSAFVQFLASHIPQERLSL